MVRPAGRGAAEAGRPVPARDRPRRRGIAAVPALPLQRAECWAGNWDAAEEYALEACRVADESHQHTMRPATLYSLALVRAHRGQVQQARELAGEALALCDRTGNVPVRSMVLSVLGFIALSLDDAQAAHSHLGRLAEAASAVGPGGTERGEVPPRRDRGAGRPRRGRPRAVVHAAARGTGEVARAPVGAGDGCAMPRPPRRPWTATWKEPGPLASRRCRSTSGCRCRSSWAGPCSSRA